MLDIFTIGHSNHPAEKLIGLLQQHGITALADVRTSPYSRRFPQFGRERLAESLRAVAIAYVFLGAELGGKRPGQSWADIARSDSFKAGLKRLREGAERHRIAYMCAEREPMECHRALLVTRHLRAPDLAIHHILADGSLEEQAAFERRLVKKAKTAPPPLMEADAVAWKEAIERAYDRVGGLATA
jgi:uncharacterized protein (DUF488 family)